MKSLIEMLDYALDLPYDIAIDGWIKLATTIKSTNYQLLWSIIFIYSPIFLLTVFIMRQRAKLQLGMTYSLGESITSAMYYILNIYKSSKNDIYIVLANTVSVDLNQGDLKLSAGAFPTRKATGYGQFKGLSIITPKIQSAYGYINTDNIVLYGDQIENYAKKFDSILIGGGVGQNDHKRYEAEIVSRAKSRTNKNLNCLRFDHNKLTYEYVGGKKEYGVNNASENEVFSFVFSFKNQYGKRTVMLLGVRTQGTLGACHIYARKLHLFGSLSRQIGIRNMLIYDEYFMVCSYKVDDIDVVEGSLKLKEFVPIRSRYSVS